MPADRRAKRSDLQDAWTTSIILNIKITIELHLDVPNEPERIQSRSSGYGITGCHSLIIIRNRISSLIAKSSRGSDYRGKATLFSIPPLLQ